MINWAEQLQAAEAGAERSQAIEHEAEGRFKAVHAQADARGDAQAALESEEFKAWMASRHATDAAWGSWAVVMDARPATA